MSPGKLEAFLGGPRKRRGSARRPKTEEDRWFEEIVVTMEYNAAEGRYVNEVTHFPKWKPESHLPVAERAAIVAERIKNAGPGVFVEIPYALTYGAGAEALAAARKKIEGDESSPQDQARG